MLPTVVSIYLPLPLCFVQVPDESFFNNLLTGLQLGPRAVGWSMAS